MGVVGLMLLGAALFLLVIGILVVRYAEFLIKRLVERKHVAAEYIAQTGGVPPGWNRWWTRFAAAKPIARIYARRKLKQIIAYFGRTPLVDDDDTRRYITGQLEQVGESWKTLSWDEMIDRRRW